MIVFNLRRRKYSVVTGILFSIVELLILKQSMKWIHFQEIETIMREYLVIKMNTDSPIIRADSKTNSKKVLPKTHTLAEIRSTQIFIHQNRRICKLKKINCLKFKILEKKIKKLFKAFKKQTTLDHQHTSLTSIVFQKFLYLKEDKHWEELLSSTISTLPQIQYF